MIEVQASSMTPVSIPLGLVASKGRQLQEFPFTVEKVSRRGKDAISACGQLGLGRLGEGA